jgi:hypothetical protein
VYVLRALKPEQSPRLWKLLVVATGLWCGFALWWAYDLVERTISAKGMDGLALGVLAYPVWFFCFFPSIPVLCALLWRNPVATKHV